MKRIKSIALLASAGLAFTAGAANNITWKGANGECAFDDSSKWSGWT